MRPDTLNGADLKLEFYSFIDRKYRAPFTRLVLKIELLKNEAQRRIFNRIIIG
ncbi:hypothetical protein RhiirB3_401384 [Rhizophagus irregularis]|uniref:Uncharacterized protein n=1 Tax=Rhizophagus irregularis TaxID=588596 RepID=A0A2I1DZE8_9GLOM|nr:hypothetical protein RhiirC2_753257 [Rhizophagus irregularis]PKY15259.1 hypothetical protein RhiirB3_401384 [Rhizophagus irregularis]